MTDLIARLEQAEFAFRDLNAELAEVAGIESRSRRDGNGKNKGREWLVDSHGGVQTWSRHPPDFTGSLDAKLPWENIVRAEQTDFGRWRAIHETPSKDNRYVGTGPRYVGEAKTEILARRIAALRARHV